MKEQLITILLIAGLNLPVYLELYKHALKNKPIWIRVFISIAYWAAAIGTQTLSAFCGILYLYFGFYRKIRSNDNIMDRDIWNINALDSVKVVFMTIIARVAILLVHLVYIIILLKLVKYNIKPQNIITYYSEASFILRIILALEIVLVAPIVEEFVFRYFLYDKVFVNKMPPFIAAFFSAALFTVLHFNVSGIPTFFGLGLFCTYLYQKKGYWAAVIAHAASNLITLLFI